MADGYTIGEAADRSGFSASALRYYEQIGLVVPAARTDAGYRLYDDGDLARLRFIARAKRLGCSLDDIRDLVQVWGDERCGPVQHRFHDLVTAKIADAAHQVDELTAFVAQLHAAAVHLAGPAVDGPCGDDCACATATSVSQAVPITLAAKPSRAGEPLMACTLTRDALAGRLDDWQTVLSHARARTTTPTGGARVELDGVDLAELARLVAAEQQCCSFFSFAITVDQRGVAVEVDAPAGASELVNELFGSASIHEGSVRDHR